MMEYNKCFARIIYYEEDNGTGDLSDLTKIRPYRIIEAKFGTEYNNTYGNSKSFGRFCDIKKNLEEQNAF